MRLYRGQPVPHQPGDQGPPGEGRNFTDCPYAALAYAQGRRGAILVLDLPEEGGPIMDERIWSIDGTGPRRWGVHGPFDPWLAGQVPAPPLRAELRREGRRSWTDAQRSDHLVKEVAWRIEAQAIIETYLATGDVDDPSFSAWPGGAIGCHQAGKQALLDALVEQVRRRTAGKRAQLAAARLPEDSVRRKLEPLVRGLFPRKEHEPVLRRLARSVVFVDTDNIEDLLSSARWTSVAWDIANLYLESLDLPAFGNGAHACLGFSADTACYISHKIFDETDPFADVVVHEVCHVVHDLRRRLIGLTEKRGLERLLPIAFGERETFAYACEAFSRIHADGRGPAGRVALAQQFANACQFPRSAVNVDRVIGLVQAAAPRRNGWKVILEACCE